MEAVHAELDRLATELEAVKGQVQTECNALRDLFARTTTAMSNLGPQHDRRLNNREAGRHLPRQFGGSRLVSGDFAFRMEGLSCDGQGGALLRKVSKLDQLQHGRNLGEELLGCPTIECSCGSCSDLWHPWRGGNAGEEDSQCESWRRTPNLARGHANGSSPGQWWNKLRRRRDSYRQNVPRT